MLSSFKYPGGAVWRDGHRFILEKMDARYQQLVQRPDGEEVRPGEKDIRSRRRIKAFIVLVLSLSSLLFLKSIWHRSTSSHVFGTSRNIKDSVLATAATGDYLLGVGKADITG